MPIDDTTTPRLDDDPAPAERPTGTGDTPSVDTKTVSDTAEPGDPSLATSMTATSDQHGVNASHDTETERETVRPRRLVRILAATLTVLFGLFVVWRGLGTELAWPFIVVLAYTPYFAACGLLVLAIAMAARHRLAVVASAAFLVAAAVLIIPRAIPTGTVTADGPEVTVMSANLGVGNGDVGMVAALVERYDVDILSVQELTPEAAEALEATPELDRLTHRHTITVPDNAAGGGIYSTFPLTDLDQLPGNFAIPAATVMIDGASPVVFAAIHTASPHRPSQFEPWTFETRALPSSTSDAPWILAGDFNATLDHAALRAVLDRGYRDAASEVGAGLIGTWAPEWFVPPVALDHVFVDERIAVTSFDVETVDGSDHSAVISTIRLPADAR